MHRSFQTIIMANKKIKIKFGYFYGTVQTSNISKYPASNKTTTLKNSIQMSTRASLEKVMYSDFG